MDKYAELKRKYDLQETLLQAKKTEIQRWKKKAQEVEERINAIDTYFRNLNWIQKLVAKLFRIGF